MYLREKNSLFESMNRFTSSVSNFVDGLGICQPHQRKRKTRRDRTIEKMKYFLDHEFMVFLDIFCRLSVTTLHTALSSPHTT